MGELASTDGASQPGLKYLHFHLVPDMTFLFGPLGGKSVLYALSSAVSPVFCLPTDAAVEPKSHTALLPKKQMDEEVE